MSWTLVRHRNGQEVPIKVSVLDAFRSGSKKSGKSAEASELAKPKANTKEPLAPKDQEDTTTTSPHPTSEPEVWTPEDDKLLREMKNSGQSWKPILIALGDGHNSESQAKARWKEIRGKPADGVAAGGDAAGGDEEEQKKNEEEKKAIGEKKKAENMAKQAEGKGGKKDKKSNRKKQSNQAKSATSQEKDIKGVAAKYDQNKWLAVASRHFDVTGQRISPEMAKEMCGSKD